MKDSDGNILEEGYIRTGGVKFQLREWNLNPHISYPLGHFISFYVKKGVYKYGKWANAKETVECKENNEKEGYDIVTVYRTPPLRSEPLGIIIKDAIMIIDYTLIRIPSFQTLKDIITNALTQRISVRETVDQVRDYYLNV